MEATKTIFLPGWSAPIYKLEDGSFRYPYNYRGQIFWHTKDYILKNTDEANKDKWIEAFAKVGDINKE